MPFLFLFLALTMPVAAVAAGGVAESFKDAGPGTLTFGAYEEQMQGPVIFTDGGALPDGRVIQQGEILAVLDGILYLYPAGTDTDAIVAGHARGAVLTDVTRSGKQEITLFNTALIPAEKGTLGPDDSQRCLKAGGCRNAPPSLRDIRRQFR